MRLTRITITGADDKSSLTSIRKLTEEFPFVEWGILVSESRFGTARYPSIPNVLALSDAASGKVAAHLCGKVASRVLSGDGPPLLGRFRIQLNGFSAFAEESVPPELEQWLGTVYSEVILQVATDRALDAASALHDRHENVQVLWDRSGGEGKFDVTGWKLPRRPGIRQGFAGGLGPDTIELACAMVKASAHPNETWLDMESGVRTGDELDFGKVRRVLETAKRFVVA